MFSQFIDMLSPVKGGIYLFLEFGVVDKMKFVVSFYDMVVLYDGFFNPVITFIGR
jgi:hypothetical protein